MTNSELFSNLVKLQKHGDKALDDGVIDAGIDYYQRLLDNPQPISRRWMRNEREKGGEIEYVST